MPLHDTNDREILPLQPDLPAQGGLIGEKRLGDVEAEHDDVSAGARLRFAEKPALLHPRLRHARQIGRRAEGEDAIHRIIAAVDFAENRVGRHGQLQRRAGIAHDVLVDLVGIVGADLLSIAIIPPVLRIVPRPFGDIEDVVADHRQAVVDALVDATDGRAHERDRDNADDHPQRGEEGASAVGPDLLHRDPDGLIELEEETLHWNKAERGMQSAELSTRSGPLPALGSAFIDLRSALGDASRRPVALHHAVPQADDATGVPGDVLLVRH